MKKVIWISPIFPYNISAGNASYQSKCINLFLEKKCSIDFVYYGNKLIGNEYENNKIFDNFYTVKCNGMPQKTFFDHYAIDDWVSSELMSFLKNILRKKEYTYIIVDYVWMSKVFNLVKGKEVIKIIIGHDKFSDRDKIFTANGISKQWFYTRESEERIGLERADFVLAITNDDKIFYERLLKGAMTKVILYFSFMKKYEFNNVTKKSTYIIGIIASDNSLNKYGVELFFKTIESSNISINNVKFLVAGQISSHISDYKNLNIEKIGYVKDKDKFYEKCDFIVCAMPLSTGLKIKVIEALEYRKPFFATKAATDGICVDSILHKVINIQSLARIILYIFSQQDDYIYNIYLMLNERTKNISDDLYLKAKSCKKNIDSEIFSKNIISKIDIIDDVTTYNVSIIIPAYNAENTIEKCIDSLKSKKPINTEIIIVNDGSTDNTLNICRYRSKINNKIKIITTKNSGQGTARNIGIKESKGEYIYFVDADDYVGPDCVYYLYNTAKEKDVDICSIDRNYIVTREFSLISSLPAWGACFKRKIAINNNIFQPAIKSGQDGIFFNMLLNYCNRFSISKKSKYFYCKNPGSTFLSSLKNELSLPIIVEQHISCLRTFYRNNNFSYDRFFLFIYDESFKFRFLKTLNKISLQQSRKIYLIIKSEILSIIKLVSKSALQHVDNLFLNIIHQDFETWKKQWDSQYD